MHCIIAQRWQRRTPAVSFGSSAWGRKAKLQQVMMTIGQKVPFEFVAIDGPASGFTDAAETAVVLAEAIRGINGLDPSRLILAGGWESASRGAGCHTPNSRGTSRHHGSISGEWTKSRLPRMARCALASAWRRSISGVSMSRPARRAGLGSGDAA